MNEHIEKNYQDADEMLQDWLPALLKEAELGSPDAMGILAFMYEEGIGVEKDPTKAKEYAEMEKNAPPFNLTDDNNTSNPWINKPTQKV